jgi:hypothetical protein
MGSGAGRWVGHGICFCMYSVHICARVCVHMDACACVAVCVCVVLCCVCVCVCVSVCVCSRYSMCNHCFVYNSLGVSFLCGCFHRGHKKQCGLLLVSLVWEMEHHKCACTKVCRYCRSCNVIDMCRMGPLRRNPALCDILGLALVEPLTSQQGYSI